MTAQAFIPMKDGQVKSQESTIFTPDMKVAFRKKIVEIAMSQLEKPYIWGAKASLSDPNPNAFDCSGLTAWCFIRAGLKMPEGSSNQFDYCKQVDVPTIGDLGFFRNQKGIYHVGIYTGKEMIEARGLQSDGIGGKVILRPVTNWVNYKNFAGFRSQPNLV